MRSLVAIGCLLVHALAFAQAGADSYPTKPIRLLVGYTPGGAVDFTARAVGERLGAALGQAVLVENRVGATGNIAAEAAARAAPDGYTLYMGTSINAVSVNLFKRLPYDPLRDLVHITGIVEVPSIMVTSTATTFRTVADVVGFAKANPEKVTYASTGPGSTPHLTAVQLSQVAGIRMVHVPYKGGAAASADLVANHVDVGISDPASVMPMIQDGRLRALGVVSKARLAELPDVPTMVEQGFVGFDNLPWYGVMAPAGTPPPIVRKLSETLQKILLIPEFRKTLQGRGMTARQPHTPEQFTELLRHDIGFYGKVLKEAGIEPQ